MSACVLARRRTGRRSVLHAAIARLMAGRRMVRRGVLWDLAATWRIRTLVPVSARTRIPTIGLLCHGI